MAGTAVKESAGLRFLYHTIPGRAALKLVSSRGVSILCGRYLDSRLSKGMIPRFVRKNRIVLSDYADEEYNCFNDFFCRRIRPELRPFPDSPDALVSPCDGLLSAYRIAEDTVIPAKQSRYSVPELLGGAPEAALFTGGGCLVFRLCVNHYHRYCYPADGAKTDNVFLKGRLHTVRPIALEKYPVFVQNCREYTFLHTERFGTVAQIEVGAMLVGKIRNNEGAGAVRRGAEKGRFLYGGSTVILLLQKDAVKLPQALFDATEAGTETPVLMGQVLGTAD